MLHSVILNSTYPARHVVLAEGQRAAQITARLLAERFPAPTSAMWPEAHLSGQIATLPCGIVPCLSRCSVLFSMS